jgi:hypothetical protein
MQRNACVYDWRSDHEQLATHIERLEWFRAQGIKTIELNQKLDDLKTQSMILVELASAEMRSADNQRSAT